MTFLFQSSSFLLPFISSKFFKMLVANKYENAMILRPFLNKMNEVFDPEPRVVFNIIRVYCCGVGHKTMVTVK